MNRTNSPLRYPGGKSNILPLISDILCINKLDRGHYAEPYAGGCGLALSLLYEGIVSDIHINDLDLSIWSFWNCVLNKTDALIELVSKTPVTMEQWHIQKAIQSNPEASTCLELGFATFFLNRTNRSGIIKGAGAIGGRNQNGNYKIDCRYNAKDLVRRIKRVERYRNRIHLSRLDAIDFMLQKQAEIPTRSFFCIDPPYFNKGSSLYTSFYGPNDHKSVSEMVLSLEKPWVVTYDNVPEISSLYRTRRQFTFNINYSLNAKRLGTELLVASKGLRIPKINIASRTYLTPRKAA